MSVFTHPFYANDDFGGLGSFGGLVRFIDDWDKHVNSAQPDARIGQRNRHGSRRSGLPTFTPRFDVKENEDSFELHGELPGVDKKNVHIEFTDPQTIIIRGSVERTHSAGTPPAGLLDNGNTMSGAITNEPHDASHQPTVEDAKEGDDTTVSKARASGDASKDNNKESKSKYWVYERQVGSFQRSFTFSSRVDQDNVQARLDNGILTVVVPKAKKPEGRRINVL